MAIDTRLLAQVCETPGVPGYEIKIRSLLLEKLKNLSDSVEVDAIGNVIARVKGRSQDKTAMAAAHMDEIGFIVKHIDDEGFVFFHTLGGHDPKTLTSQRVVIHGREDVIGCMGSKPIHIMEPEDRKKAPKHKEYFIDLGMKKKEVEKLVAIGDPVTRNRELIEMGDCVNCKSLDNRVSVFVLLEVLRSFKESGQAPAYDFVAAFTVQEEVGLRGANVAAAAAKPDFGFGLDTTIAFDVPGSQKHEQVTRLGDGTAVKVMDSSVICDYRMVEFMKSTARSHKIRHQLEILTAGGTDTAALQQRVPGGSIAGAISIPTRHIHQVIEMSHKEDIKASIDLLAACLSELDRFDWSFSPRS